MFKRGMLKKACSHLTKCAQLSRGYCYSSYQPNDKEINKEKQNPNISAKEKEMIDNVQNFRINTNGHPMLAYQDNQLKQAGCVEVRASVSSTPVYKNENGIEIECHADITRTNKKGDIDRQYAFKQKFFVTNLKYLNRGQLRTKIGSEKENELNEVLTKKEKDE